MIYAQRGFLLTVLLASPGIQVAYADTPKLVSQIFLPSVLVPAESAHLQPLKDITLQPNEREVRIWIGFGVLSQMELVRLRLDSTGQIHGEAIFSYERPPNSPSSDDGDYYYSELNKKCKAIGSSGDWQSCQPISSIGTDWPTVYHSMLALNLWDLPDDSELPRSSTLITDGVAMLVELRDGANYRAYSYSNPGTNNAPEAEKAAKIMGIADHLSQVEIQ